MWMLPLLLACRSEPVAPPTETTGPSGTDTASTPDATTPTGSTGLTGSTGPTGAPDTGTPLPVGDPPLRFVGARPRNVLMISMDTFRRDHIDPYGGLGLTPTLEARIAGGVSASDAMQCSNWTFASTSCTLLGRDPVEHGFLPRLESAVRAPYPDGERFLAVALAEQGFHTVLTSRNGFLSLDEDVNNAQGYATVLSGLRPSEAQYAGALEHLLEVGEADPWFVHIHITEPHAPYDPPEEYLTKGLAGLDPIDFDLRDNDDVNALRTSWQDLDPDTLALVQAHLAVHYQAEVRWLDDQLAVGLDAFEAAGFLDDTLVVFWTDHGEQFMEHGDLTHAYDLHVEENQALFALWAPTLEPAVWDGPVTLADLPPTVFAALGLPLEPQWTGAPLGQAPPDRDRLAVAVTRADGHNALRRGPHKLVFEWSTGERVLFDVVADPGETVDGFDPADPTSAAMWSALRPYVEGTSALAPDIAVVWPD